MSEDQTTADRIVDIVEDLVMARGFNAISYADVAEIIGIRKASIHYHFPTKAALGEAVIRRYTDRMADALTPAAGLPRADFAPAFERFLAVFASVGEGNRRVCLGGVLGAEFETLPDGVRDGVRRFYVQCQSWLAELLEEGRATGAFAFSGAADDAARAIFSALEGALIIGRALDDADQLAAAMRCARAIAGLRG